MKSPNERAAECVVNAEPAWMGVEAAGKFLGLKGNVVLHAGPPIAYGDMCVLHRRGMVNACFLEGWAQTENDAERLLETGEVRVECAMDYATVGSGTGIVTPSVPLLVVEDKTTGKRAGVFPAEGQFGGGFCGWGVFSPEIAANLAYLRDTLFAPLCLALDTLGGFPLGEIITTAVLMGDENHSSQRAADALFIRKILPVALKTANAEKVLSYFASTNRFFHNFGQAASRAALLSAGEVKGASMIVAAGGNGVEYGIKIAGGGNRWFTASSPMIEGKYMTPGAKRENQLPWIGDSSITECAGLGGLLSAAAPETASWRGDKLADAVKTTSDMLKICVRTNPHVKIPAMDFAEGPCGIDAEKVVATGIEPVIDGGMIDRNGGWLGAGAARMPLACFTQALNA